MHSAQRFSCSSSVHFGPKLLLLVQAALCSPLFFQIIQFHQALLEDIKRVPFACGKVASLHLLGSHRQHFPVGQCVGALLVLNIVIAY